MKDKIKPFIELHILLLVYSLGGIFSKLAGQSDFLSLRFMLFYGVVFLDLAVYAIVWQQILKKLPLVTAYANKAITVIWGLLWGMLIFKEKITIFNVLGALVIIFGIYMVVKSDET
ncbi:MAG: transporter [Lachnospiraceae bacterium]|nr:transporter [Lachnospiraceae bacterium]MBQ9233687.1 transporter [Lachnospiraceae bacterium]